MVYGIVLPTLSNNDGDIWILDGDLWIHLHQDQDFMKSKPPGQIPSNILGDFSMGEKIFSMRMVGLPAMGWWCVAELWKGEWSEFGQMFGKTWHLLQPLNPEPLRKEDTVWVPRLGKPTGIDWDKIPMLVCNAIFILVCISNRANFGWVGHLFHFLQ